MKQIHKINGRTVKPPVNYEEIELDVNYDNDNPNRSVNITRFSWAFEEWALIKSIYDAGLSGGNGIFEGVPHTIELEENGVPYKLLDGYLDLTSAVFDENQVEVDTVPRAQIDWLNDVAEGFTFEYLKEKGLIIPVRDYEFMPYVIDSVPNYKESMIITMTITFVTIELTNVLKELSNYGGQSTTVIDSAGGVIGLIANIIYAVALLITITDLMLDLVQLIIQPIKYKPMMSIRKHMEIACGYLGLTYSSSLLDADPYDRLYVIPESFNNLDAQSDNRLFGFLSADETRQNGFYNGTFADLIRAMKDMFNARVRIVGNELQILPSLKTLNSASFTLPDYDVDRFETNATDVVGTYLISYSYDTTEKQTIQNWQGNNFQVVLQPIKKGSSDLTLIKGLTRVQLPFARAIRKTELTTPENVADTLLNFVGTIVSALVNIANAAIKGINATIKVINNLKNALSVIGIKIKANIKPVKTMSDPGIGELIDSRIGVMLLESDIISIPKITIAQIGSENRKNKVSDENESYLTAKKLYEKHHFTNSFAPNSKNAQRIIYQFDQVEMNLSEVKIVEQEGVVRLPNGNLAEVIEMKYNPSSRLCNFVLHERKMYTNNLTEVKIEPIGR